MIVKSFAKINLSIDVGPLDDNGYHRVDMVMQQLSFHDDVTVEYMPSDPGPEDCGTASGDGGSFDIEVSTNRYYLPVDRRNLAYQAAELMAELVSDGPSGGSGQDSAQSGHSDDKSYGSAQSGHSDDKSYGSAPGSEGPVHVRPGKIKISIRKRIPVAGGLAGGSGNAAAVLHALNIIWDLGLSLSELMDLGAKLGSDVPFCVMGQARSNRDFPEYIRKDKLAASCARATGRGTELVPVTPLDSWMVISKPRFSVSTKEVYEGIDGKEITGRPDNDRLVKCMAEKARNTRHRSAHPDADLYRDFINVLEEYTLESYPEVAELKKKMLGAGARFALMSGSGPTVFGIFGSMSEAEKAAEKLRAEGLEAYWTRTAI